MRIRIKDTPPGFPPRWVREGWVGIELESSGRERGDELGLRVGNQNRGGYRVKGKHAFDQLKEHNHDAFVWWQTECPWVEDETLIFRADVCEEIQEST